MPKAPTFLLDSVKQIHQLEGEGICLTSSRKHGEEGAEILADENCRVLKLGLSLPDGMLVSIDRFNEVIENGFVVGKQLQSHFRILEVPFAKNEHGDSVTQLIPFIHWKFLIVGSERAKTFVKPKPKKDMLQDAVSRLSNLKLQK